MQHNLDLLALPAVHRLHVRQQVMSHRRMRLAAQRACIRQVQGHAVGHMPLTAEAIDQAHEAHVVLGIVGQPVWTN
mgnify:CR=1 FL=1|jgi:hypothetical protein